MIQREAVDKSAIQEMYNYRKRALKYLVRTLVRTALIIFIRKITLILKKFVIQTPRSL